MLGSWPSLVLDGTKPFAIVLDTPPVQLPSHVRNPNGWQQGIVQMPSGWRQRISLKSWPTALWWLWAPLALNVVSIFVLCLGAFRANASYLFYGLDGRFEVSIISQATLFTYPTLGFTNDFIHGLGNIWFPINPWLIPAYVLSLTAPGDFSNFPLAYAICATELFIGTYLTARIATCPRIAGLAGAWLIVLLCFPFVGRSLLPM